MCLKYKFSTPLDSPGRTLEHKNIIRSKLFLRKIYIEWYQHFVQEFSHFKDKKIIELGSGGGFIKEIMPGVTCSDIQPISGIDMCFSAQSMPFIEKSVHGICMINTFHHLADAGLFLKEVDRVLADNGKLILIEPANSLWGRFIYKRLHHEVFDPSAGWNLQKDTPLSVANGALPWIVFIRDRERLLKLFPNFKIDRIKYHTPFCYLLSGGMSYKQFVPAWSFVIFKSVDKWLSKVFPQMSMFMTIPISKSEI